MWTVFITRRLRKNWRLQLPHSNVQTLHLVRAWAELQAAARISTAEQQLCRWRWWWSASGPKHGDANSSLQQFSHWLQIRAFHGHRTADPDDISRYEPRHRVNSHLLLCYLRPVVVVSQRRIHRQVGEVLPDGLGHVGNHLDHHVCRELISGDMRWTVTGGEDKQDAASSNRLKHVFMFISSLQTAGYQSTLHLTLKTRHSFQ